MSTPPLVKICGITTPDILHVCADAGARFAGFVFYPKSVRYLSPDAAPSLLAHMPASMQSVGLFVDPDDDAIAAVTTRTRLDMIQLHGDETPERIAHIKSRFDIPVMKAVCVADASDLVNLGAFQGVADWILFDAKLDGALPGGNGAAFDWKLLQHVRVGKPWMLSGGLTAENLASALSVLTPHAVDVSSGVEETRGVKSPERIRRFLQAAG